MAEDPAPAVSVVIPSHRGGVPLRRALDSVWAQRYEGPIEAIVVFDACDDRDTGEEPERASRSLRVLTNEGPPGPAGARNTGLGAATGAFVGFLDDDDRWSPDKLDRQLARMAVEGATVATCGVRYVADGRFKDHLPEVADDMTRAVVERGSFVPLQTLLVDAGVLRDVGGFDDAMWVGEDTDLVLRLAATASFCRVDEPLVEMARGHTERLSLDYARHHEGFMRLSAKHREAFARWPKGRARRYWRFAGLALMSGERAEARMWADRAVRSDPSPRNVAMAAAAWTVPRSVFARAFQAYQTLGWRPLEQAQPPPEGDGGVSGGS
jgi:glycosyltransferase involved in cell wall biosynthesis